jgi:hypothetical protein
MTPILDEDCRLDDSGASVIDVPLSAQQPSGDDHSRLLR